MTTIAYKDGILAGDTMYTEGNIKGFNAKKLFKYKQILIGHSGWCDIVFHPKYLESLYRSLIKNSKLPEIFDGLEYSILAIKESKIYTASHDIPYFTVLPDKYYAVGSGKSIALSIMDYGGSAIDAVKIAIKRDVYSGGKVTYVSI